MAYIIVSLIFTILFLFLGVDSVLASSTLLNEFMPHPSSGNDWIEIYNPTSSAIDLSGWSLVDNTSTMKTLSGSIAANEFIVFEVSNRLNNSGDNIYLKDSSGSTVDNYSYSSDPGTNQSYGRNPDGGNWVILVSQSKGISNGNSYAPTPTPSASPTLSPSIQPSTTSSTLFTISNTPSQINSDQSFSAKVNLSLPSNPSSPFYLKGAFKKSDSSNYFGLTKVSNSWVKNGSGYSDQFKITTDSSGNWSGNLEVQPDSEDSGFTGSGDYTFKIGRYNSSGSGPTWGNETTINITAVNIDQGGTETINASSENSPTQSTPSPSTLKNNASLPSQLKSSKNILYKIATVAGISSDSTTSSIPIKEGIKSAKQFNGFLIAGFLLLICGFGCIGYVYLLKRKIT